MNFHHLDRTIRDDIAKQIQQMVDPFLIDGKLGSTEIPRDLKIFESCRECIIDLPQEWAQEEAPHDFHKWSRADKTWYHQLRTETSQFGFARSIETKGGHRIIEVIPSLVAESFQIAVHALDLRENARDSTPESFAALLHVPRYTLYGFIPCLADVAASSTIVDDWTFSSVYQFYPRHDDSPVLHGTLADLLQRLPPVFGVYL